MKNRSRRPTTDPRPDTGNRLGWRIGIAIIAPAAAGIVAWSLFVVAHDMYGVPWLLAVLVAACFDGAALACLHLASEAVRENRSALGPRLATLGLAAVSMYLNRVHALHIDGGLPATLLFAAPTVALLVLADLSWAATRARHRISRGEHPVKLPVFGWLGWALARGEAWTATKNRAVQHVTGQSTDAEPDAGERTAGELLASELSDMTPSKAIRIMHEARPELTPGQLADVLRQYGQHVTELDVAVVLDRVPRPAEVSVSRADTGPQPAAAPAAQHLVITVQQPPAIGAGPAPYDREPQHEAPQDDAGATAGQSTGGEPLGAPGSVDRIVDDALAGVGTVKADAVRAVRRALPGLPSAQVAEHITRRGIEGVTGAYVRTIVSRDRKTQQQKATRPPAPGRGHKAGPYL